MHLRAALTGTARTGLLTAAEHTRTDSQTHRQTAIAAIGHLQPGCLRNEAPGSAAQPGPAHAARAAAPCPSPARPAGRPGKRSTGKGGREAQRSGGANPVPSPSHPRAPQLTFLLRRRRRLLPRSGEPREDAAALRRLLTAQPGERGKGGKRLAPPRDPPTAAGARAAAGAVLRARRGRARAAERPCWLPGRAAGVSQGRAPGMTWLPWEESCPERARPRGRHQPFPAPNHRIN